MVLLEVMRLYPPLGFLNRHVMVDYKIPDTDIVLEKGTPIFIPSLGLHYDPQYFPDPYKFDPERFSKENKRTIPSCVYLPFGDGPHSCIGEWITIFNEINFLIRNCNYTKLRYYFLFFSS